MFSIGMLCIFLAAILWQWNNRIVGPQTLKVYFLKDRGGLMNALLTWTPDVGTDVVSQHLIVLLNGAAVFDGDIADNTTAQYSFGCNPGDNISATLTSFNGILHSAPVSVNGTAPSVPAGPTGFNLSFTQ